MKLTLVVRNVLAVLPDGARRVDIEIADGVIVGLPGPGEGRASSQVIDGAGLEAFPGVIDPHVHFRRYESMGVDGDGLVDILEEAPRGGVTTLMAFLTAPEDESAPFALRELVGEVKDAPTDIGIHVVLWPRPDRIGEIPELAEIGVRSFKMFMAYAERGFMFDGKHAIEALAAVAQVGGLTLIHAEDGHSIHWGETISRERLGSDAKMKDYFTTRPRRGEAVGIELACLWAEIANCPIYIVHLSSGPGLEVVRSRLADGAPLSVETGPQYLVLDQEIVADIGPRAKFAPAVGPPSYREELWGGLQDGSISIIGSDHSGHRGSIKEEIARREGVFSVPYGVPGLETMFPLLYTHGILGGRITREQLAAVASTNAARRFGWYPYKGALATGSSADIVLIDPSEKRPVESSRLRTRAGYSPYEGMVLTGWPKVTLFRGRVVFDGSEVQPGGGSFLASNPRQVARSGAQVTR